MLKGRSDLIATSGLSWRRRLAPGSSMKSVSTARTSPGAPATKNAVVPSVVVSDVCRRRRSRARAYGDRRVKDGEPFPFFSGGARSSMIVGAIVA